MIVVAALVSVGLYRLVHALLIRRLHAWSADTVAWWVGWPVGFCFLAEVEDVIWATVVTLPIPILAAVLGRRRPVPEERLSESE